MPCTTILAGKKVTNDNSTIISRSDDGGFDVKKVTVMLPQNQPKTYNSVISHLSIELPEKPLRYTYAPNVSKHSGIWPACGINEANVAMTASETITSNPRVLSADPYVSFQPKTEENEEQAGGIGEEDLVTLVLPYIKTAREGVLRLGSLLEQYGTYEANGVAFSDANEIWWLETIGGHHWIAKRVPDDRIVIMPNQFGLDDFDFKDAFGPQEANLCSSDLQNFTESFHLYTGLDPLNFNPRLAYGSRKDGDRLYNTPRAWFMARYLLERTYKWDGDSPDFTPESNDIPWSFKPERKVTIEEIKYLLSSYYQGTPYCPYSENSSQKGKYRSIGVPNSDVCGILQIRGDLPKEIQSIEWLSMGGGAFTSCFPVYTFVDRLPSYIDETPETVSTESMYWQSRLIAALTDAHYKSSIIYSERYQESVFTLTRKILNESDSRILKNGFNTEILEEANEKIIKAVKAESDKALGNLLKNASSHMKTVYHRGDN